MQTVALRDVSRPCTTTTGLLTPHHRLPHPTHVAVPQPHSSEQLGSNVLRRSSSVGPESSGGDTANIKVGSCSYSCCSAPGSRSLSLLQGKLTIEVTR